MRGGYRLGAGRPGREIKVEDCLRLSIHSLKTHGVLEKNWAGLWAWPVSGSGHAQSVVGICTTNLAVHLRYYSQGKIVRVELKLNFVPNTYGGRRIYFLCPKCNSRRRDLYFLDGFFLCLVCHELPYQSQSEGFIDRLWRAEQKIERRLGSRYRRPNGMHRSTFRRLQEKLLELEYQRELQIDSFFEDLLAPDSFL